ncbi:MAG: NAD(P)H-dependent oxidoreductase subunit E, partial [Dehalococcoidia bacterium]
MAGNSSNANEKRSVLVCQALGCLSSHSDRIIEAIRQEVERSGLSESVEVKPTGCPGLCQEGPIVLIDPERVFYTRVKPEDAVEIVQSLMPGGQPVERLLYHDAQGKPIYNINEVPYYVKQQHIVLRNCGHINPEDIDEYIAVAGYEGLRKVLAGMTPAEVIEEVTSSGLRGRGGAGFPTGRKWAGAQRENREPKYVVCNADEGDPGAFMDRSTLESDPHTVIEGMIICGYAIDSHQGYIYVRAEYPLAIKRLRIALKQAKDRGLLGKNILGSGFDYELEIREGAGAFVCGEASALMYSIEGKRGMPRVKPPRSVESGLWGLPTVLNNVKTFASIPVIMLRGSEWYAGIGSPKSPGTAVFALTGKVANSGLIEVPMGTSLREIIFDIGGGLMGGKDFKAVQTGGPSGGCLPASQLDLPVDFDSLDSAGSIMGSGGMVVMDE